MVPLIKEKKTDSLNLWAVFVSVEVECDTFWGVLSLQKNEAKSKLRFKAALKVILLQ